MVQNKKPKIHNLDTFEGQDIQINQNQNEKQILKENETNEFDIENISEPYDPMLDF